MDACAPYDGTTKLIVEARSNNVPLFTVRLEWVPRPVSSFFTSAIGASTSAAARDGGGDDVIELPAALSMWPLLHSACDPRTTTLRVAMPGLLTSRRALPPDAHDDDVSRLSVALEAAKTSKALANADFAAKRFAAAMERYAAAAHEASFCAILCLDGAAVLPGSTARATSSAATRFLEEAKEVGAVCLSNYAQSTLEWLAAAEEAGHQRQKTAAAERALRRIRRARNLLQQLAHPSDSLCRGVASIQAEEASVLSQRAAMRMKVLLREAKLLLFLGDAVESTRLLTRIVDEADRQAASLKGSVAGDSDGVRFTESQKLLVDVYEAARSAACGELTRVRNER